MLRSRFHLLQKDFENLMGKINDVAVVMVPLPAQGHLNQLLHLTRIISTRGLPVHFIGSSIHNRQAKDQINGWNLTTLSNIQFHDFELPHFNTPPADPSAANKFPSHLVQTFEAYINLREPLGKLLKELSFVYRRVVVVHDSLMAFADEEASFIANVEAYSFISVSAFALIHAIRRVHGAVVEKDIPEDIPRVSFAKIVTDDFEEFATRNSQWLKFCSGEIFNSCDAIEKRFLKVIDDLRKDKKVWAIGPFHPLKFDSNGDHSHYCLEWLDRQPQNSVIYVSFGTMTSISDAQIDELASGLEHSKQRFIWVMRDADRGDIYNGEVRKTQLPVGFEERVKGVGVVVRDWAPQLQILAHSSTGGFMSHCGWNSTIESLSIGVPIAAWPMHSDQPSNAFLITEVLNVGLTVRDWCRRKELILAHEIGSSVKTLMLSDEGDMMRKNAKELGIKVCQAVSDGGTSTMQLDSLLAHITR